MSDPGYEVTQVEPVRVIGPDRLVNQPLMSAYVWREQEKDLFMLVRSRPIDLQPTGSIWYAKGDGLVFEAGDAPILVPGPGDLDSHGCEDPTVVRVEDRCLVYYTGVRQDGLAQLLYADGPDIHSLTKRGVAHAATASDRNTKEAAVERAHDRWILLFEYSRKGCSRVGHAEGSGPVGPWQEHPDPFRVRPESWDSRHLSTGPLLLDEPGGRVMFYNGGTDDGNWAIGWIKLDTTCRREVARCSAPLIPMPSEPNIYGQKIAFASSAVTLERGIWLYYTENDRSLFRATLRRL